MANWIWQNEIAKKSEKLKDSKSNEIHFGSKVNELMKLVKDKPENLSSEVFKENPLGVQNLLKNNDEIV